MSKEKAKIYFSYAWNDDKSETGKSREDLVTKIYDSLKNDGFDVRRDKENCTYGESISNFIEEIGKGDLIIVFTSDKYFKSPFCMEELYKIGLKNNLDKDNFQKNILPVIVEFVEVTKPVTRRKYLTYWKGERDNLTILQNEHPDAMNLEDYKQMEVAKRIYNEFTNLTLWLSDINASNNKLLEENDFEIIKQKIIERIGKPTTTTMQENDCPKTYEEFKEYIAKNTLADTFDMVEEYLYEKMDFSDKTTFNMRKNQYKNDKNKISESDIKEVLPMLVKKHLA
jgi:hypothetical protein